MKLHFTGLFSHLPRIRRFRTKLLISYLSIVMLLSITIGYSSFRNSYGLREQEAYEASSWLLRDVALATSGLLDKVESASQMLCTNEDVQECLRRAVKGYQSLVSEIDDYRTLSGLLKIYQEDTDIYRIRMFVQGQPLYCNERYNFFGTQCLADDAFYKGLVKGNFLAGWRGAHQQEYLYERTHDIVSLYRIIKDLDNYRSSLGVLVIDVDSAAINVILDRTGLGDDSLVVLYEGDDIIGFRAKGTATSADPLDVVRHIEKQDPRDLRDVEVGRHHYVALRYNVGGSRWRVALFTSSENVKAEMLSMGYITLILTVPFVLAGVALSILLSRTISRRVTALALQMEAVGKGRYGQSVVICGNDEVAKLQLQFNKMSAEIARLFDRVYKISILKKTAELRALESQINQHFLYNTLDTIKWMSAKKGARDICSIVESLSKYFRLMLSNGEELLTVREELDRVKAYLTIQNYRLQGGISYLFDVDEDIGSCRILKLVVQPIVENSVTHGIMKKKNKAGRIAIKARREDAKLVFTIADDGIGMDKIRVKDLIRKDRLGYGLRSIHERVKLYYGAGSGLRVESVLGKGTKVTLTLVGATVGGSMVSPYRGAKAQARR